MATIPAPSHWASVSRGSQGLDDTLAQLVAGARNHLQADRSLGFRFEVTA